jgi:uncharacterized protein YebE (UPF0316 family)
MFELEVSGALLLGALLIFLLRVIGVTLATLRVLVMTRGSKLGSAALGFFEVLVYVLAIGEVVNNLSNFWNILGYCLGFSAGTLVGMWLDEHYITSFANVRIISRYKAQGIVEAVRKAGYGATLEWAAGRNGSVGLILATVNRREVKRVCEIADAVDAQAFITVEEARAVRRGHMNPFQLQK